MVRCTDIDDIQQDTDEKNIADKIIEESSFGKESEGSFTHELFQVTEQIDLSGSPAYKIQDLLGEEITGMIQEPEMRLAEPGALDHHYIEKLLRRKANKRFVKWVGWPMKHNQWLSKSEITKFRKPIYDR